MYIRYSGVCVEWVYVMKIEWLDAYVKIKIVQRKTLGKNFS